MNFTYYLVFSLLLFSITSNSQSYNWAISIGGNGTDEGKGIAVDGTGNIYVTGVFEDTVDLDPGNGVLTFNNDNYSDAFILKLDSQGNLIWAKSLVCPINGGIITPLAISLDQSGDLLITGTFGGTADFDPGPNVVNLSTPSMSSCIFVLKLTNGGEFLWVKNLGFGRGRSIDTDSYRNVLITGFHKETNNSSDYDIFISKLSSNGDSIWTNLLEGTSVNEGYSLRIDGSGNIITTGAFSATLDFDPGSGVALQTSQGLGDFYLAKFTSSGDFTWVKTLGGYHNDPGFAVTLDGSGNIYTTGFFSGTVDFDPGPNSSNLVSPPGFSSAFLLKMDMNGNFLWAKSLEGNSYSTGMALYSDIYGNIYSCGHFQGTADFDPGTGIANLTSNGYGDIFFVKLDVNGNMIWAQSIGDTLDDILRSIYVDNLGFIYSTGSFQGTVDFDWGLGIASQTSIGEKDIFVFRMSDNTVLIPENPDSHTVIIYPNPTTGLLIVDGETVNKVELLNISGEIIAVYTHHKKVDLASFSSGTYLVKVYYQNGSKIFKVIRQ